MASATKVGTHHIINKRFPEIPDVIDKYGRIRCLICYYRDEKYVPLNSYNKSRECSYHPFDALEKLLIKKGLIQKRVEEKNKNEIKIYLDIPVFVNIKLNELYKTMKKDNPALNRQGIIIDAIKDYLTNPDRIFKFNFEGENKIGLTIILPLKLNEKLSCISESARKKRDVNCCTKNRHIILALIRILNYRNLSGI